MQPKLREAAMGDPEARRSAEIEAAWALHTTPEHRVRRTWLERHLERQHGRCAYCNSLIKADVGSGWDDLRATVDHVTARSRGGPDVEENTVAACAACNLHKADMSEQEFLCHPVRLARLRAANTPPDRLAADPRSPFYVAEALKRGVGVRFRGQQRDDVEEYCLSESWVRVPAGRSVDRRGRPLTVKLSGAVQAYYADVQS